MLFKVFVVAGLCLWVGMMIYIVASHFIFEAKEKAIDDERDERFRRAGAWRRKMVKANQARNAAQKEAS